MNSRETTPPDSPDTVSLKLSDDARQVLAVLPGAEQAALTAADLQRMLSAEGYGEWRELDAGIAQACSLAGKSPEPREVAIAEYVDGQLSISVSDDSLQAFLTVTAPQGGSPVDTRMIQQALAEQGISHGIVHTALHAGPTEKRLIAQGEPATDGEDTRFESLLPDVQDRRPKINEDGTVDYHEIGAFVTVSAGDALMRKHPPTTGTNGCDVYGKAIMARPGRELAFAYPLSGAEVDDEDPDLLRASIGGQPEFVDHGMNVNPVMNVHNIDLTTGNVDFDGTVNVQGDVAEGLRIQATGDVRVSGMVDGAVIQANGDIAVSGGVIGRGNVRNESRKRGPGTAQLKSGGCISARFIENAIVEAAKDITVHELVAHSDLTALNCIVVGKKGSKKGHILGGFTKATAFISAQVIGSQAHVRTALEVGSDPALHDEIRHHERTLADKEAEYDRLTTLIGRLRSATDEHSKQTLERVFATLKQTGDDAKELKKELTCLKARHRITDKARVEVKERAYPNTSICIGDASTVVREAIGAGDYTLSDKTIVFSLA